MFRCWMTDDVAPSAHSRAFVENRTNTKTQEQTAANVPRYRIPYPSRKDRRAGQSSYRSPAAQTRTVRISTSCFCPFSISMSSVCDSIVCQFLLLVLLPALSVSSSWTVAQGCGWSMRRGTRYVEQFAQHHEIMTSPLLQLMTQERTLRQTRRNPRGSSAGDQAVKHRD